MDTAADKRPNQAQALPYEKLMAYGEQLFIGSDHDTVVAKYRKRSEAMAIMLGADTGLRSSDLFTLKWRDVKAYADAPNSYYVEVNRQRKTRRRVSNPISHTVSALLQEYKATCIATANAKRLKVSDYIFYNYLSPKAGEGLPLFTRAWLRKRLKRAAEGGNFGNWDASKGLGGHTLRRSYAIYVYERRDLRLASKALGHQSMATTSSYLALDAKEVDTSLRELKQV
jgi:integrase